MPAMPAAIPCLLLALCQLLAVPTDAASCFKFKNQPDPCAGKVCANNAECLPSLKGRWHKCVCLQHCWDVGDSDDSGPVCGSNAVDYPSLCHLRRESCHAAVNVEVKLRGKCNPCADKLCPATKRCQLDSNRRPFCDCTECTVVSAQPVCGTDGVTYADECSLRYRTCRRHAPLLPIAKLYAGHCRPGQHCTQQCPHAYMQCRVDAVSLVSECRCPTECPAVLDPVCGTDGRVYESVCHLQVSACRSNRTVFPLLRGDCGDSGGCRLARNRCPYGGVCRLLIEPDGRRSYTLRASCHRPVCARDVHSLRADLRVCGSDNVTYKSECHLRQEAFDSKRQISVRHSGKCDACASVVCPFYGLCRVSDTGRAECHCQNSCLFLYRPVCGSDGVTYEMDCEMRMAACRQQRNITELHRGPCTGREVVPTPAPATRAPGRPGTTTKYDYGTFWEDEDGE